MRSIRPALELYSPSLRLGWTHVRRDVMTMKPSLPQSLWRVRARSTPVTTTPSPYRASERAVVRASPTSLRLPVFNKSSQANSFYMCKKNKIPLVLASVELAPTTTNSYITDEYNIVYV